jgi:hypothetical protein
MATSDPAFSGIVPSLAFVPRAKGRFVSPTGGVAPLVARVIAETTHATATITSAPLTARFMTSSFPDLSVRLAVPRLENARSSSLRRRVATNSGSDRFDGDGRAHP